MEENQKEYTQISTLPTPADVNKAVQFEGTVLRSSNTKLLENKRMYRCSKCKREFEVEAQVETSFQFEMPPFCGGTTRTGDLCKNKKFTQCGNAETIDYQELRIQEPIHNFVTAGLQRQVSVILLGQNVGEVQTGDFVTIKGIVKVRWISYNIDEIPELEIVVLVDEIISKNVDKMAINVTTEMEEEFKAYWEENKNHPIKGRDMILQSICPELCGLRMCKLAVMLVATGGISRIDKESKTKTRGTIHLLLVGDPGTGKSQLLKFASKLGPRHVQTTGGGTTSAGLTVSVINIGGELSLDAGALVLADGGVCCIDEFSGINKSDRADIHEAMEQQTLSVAKAGIVSQLHTRTAILAATNPKGRYDPTKSMSLNTAIDPPLLSRFDIILLLLDDRSKIWDEQVSDYVLNGHKPINKPLFDCDQLQCYILYVKMHFFPEMTEEAELVIQKYFQYQRGKERRESGRTTIRLFESLIRISQAHAKLMMHHTVTLMDAVMAILLIESSYNGASNKREYSEFPIDPDKQYEEEEIRLLQTLQLEYLIDNKVNSQNTSDELTKMNEEKIQNKKGYTQPLNNISQEDYEKSIQREEEETRKSFWNNYMDSQRKSEMTGIVFPSQRMRGGPLKKGQSINFLIEKRKSEEQLEEIKKSQNLQFNIPTKMKSISNNQKDIEKKTDQIKEQQEINKEVKQDDEFSFDSDFTDLFELNEENSKDKNKEIKEITDDIDNLLETSTTTTELSLKKINSFSKQDEKPILMTQNKHSNLLNKIKIMKSKTKQETEEEKEESEQLKRKQSDDEFSFDDIDSLFQEKRDL
ncbi:hypothetical protein ENUP19_0198G0016 [Entamoeba nuttalli]|uniref:DNA helicase n=2 Tax=Entamoeba nuttalli TaxID=412467 RepID=K2GBC0_ENTNP|nr:DNA replication licensing factor, putative [Entamoeba nuttalli P19]EKE39811.1 DNA replication licensing factor, putative [Entamoeba nuttalli P19]|eukprot:XP_008857855.1 DNA replication licensing factor, putative [Entamoeba nuttalli P19]